MGAIIFVCGSAIGGTPTAPTVKLVFRSISIQLEFVSCRAEVNPVRRVKISRVASVRSAERVFTVWPFRDRDTVRRAAIRTIPAVAPVKLATLLSIMLNGSSWEQFAVQLSPELLGKVNFAAIPIPLPVVLIISFVFPI